MTRRSKGKVDDSADGVSNANAPPAVAVEGAKIRIPWAREIDPEYFAGKLLGVVNEDRRARGWEPLSSEPRVDGTSGATRLSEVRRTRVEAKPEQQSKDQNEEQAQATAAYIRAMREDYPAYFEGLVDLDELVVTPNAAMLDDGEDE